MLKNKVLSCTFFVYKVKYPKLRSVVQLCSGDHDLEIETLEFHIGTLEIVKELLGIDGRDGIQMNSFHAISGKTDLDLIRHYVPHRHRAPPGSLKPIS